MPSLSKLQLFGFICFNADEQSLHHLLIPASRLSVGLSTTVRYKSGKEPRTTRPDLEKYLSGKRIAMFNVQAIQCSIINSESHTSRYFCLNERADSPTDLMLRRMSLSPVSTLFMSVFLPALYMTRDPILSCVVFWCLLVLCESVFSYRNIASSPTAYGR